MQVSIKRGLFEAPPFDGYTPRKFSMEKPLRTNGAKHTERESVAQIT